MFRHRKKVTYCKNCSVSAQYCISDLTGLLGLKSRAEFGPARSELCLLWVTFLVTRSNICFESLALLDMATSVCAGE